jgi:hypothetical protein
VLTFNSEIISKEFFNGFAQGQQQELFDVSLGIDEFHIFLDRNRQTISQRAEVQQLKHQSICHILSCRRESEESNFEELLNFMHRLTNDCEMYAII